MLWESLESRTLMSVTPINAQVKLDRLTVKADMLKFRSDLASGVVTVFQDVTALKADDASNSASLVPLFKAMRADARHMHQQLFADRLIQSAATLRDQREIVHELRQIIRDHGNDTALAADRQALLADRVQLQTDDVAGLNTRIGTRQAAYSTLSADLSAIVTSVQNEVGASTQTIADAQQLAGDRTSMLATLSTDLTTLVADRTTLAADLMALET